MIIFMRQFIFGVVLISLLVSQSFAQSPVTNASSFLKEENEKLGRIYGEIMVFFNTEYKANTKTVSWDYSSSIATVNRLMDYVNTAILLVDIYDRLTCKLDREVIAGTISERFSGFAAPEGTGNVTVTLVDLYIDRTKQPRLAITYNELKNISRELNDFFKTFKLDSR